ncbi:hypothetical protein BJ138DRAFT_1138790 [Hygrophoropsis aurantiaca]|uniref:Uncharacterized protein n=1 Tax=Hygrophoropsis aurantiaca TaxID=72124 RepID=A0ACB7ZPV2_9AGAM|nr:hypothetical protein BJ138DRAFT_1138790 [Hygrophoropsis aurantiaca]
MECHVDQLRENGKRRQKRPRIVVEGDEDEYEDGMRIPVLVLDGCGASFLAADEKREKASTWFFADTGLMAMLCCHDRVLWLVNMTSAGEKQHYALTLINTLFNHIPADMTVGLLYNIGCQLERSCQKWNFLPNAILSRMSFAISVFHAYGHQWPCQIIYHPRKRIGFGLSDGEGCEHLWSSLKPLIPVLRVSGYHQRLFVLDVQVHQLDAKSLAAFGQWLSRKWIQCQAKKGAALDKLATLGVSDDLLREEWAAQIAYQTKPLPRRSKSKGAEAIANILALEKTLDIHQSTVKDLERQLVTNHVSNIIDFNLQLSEARRRRDTIIETLARRRMALDRVRQRKFELEKLERAYRNTVNEYKMHGHVQASIKRRKPTILKLVTTYNSLCTQLRSLIRHGKAPRGVVPPAPMSRKGLFLLDVDDEIWQDIGLDDDMVDPPLWLANEDVRAGIRLLLEVDRCEEEEARLCRERCVLQEWMISEWEAIERAKLVSGDDMLYQLKSRADELLRPIPCAWDMPESWGPSVSALADAAHTIYHARTYQTEASERAEEDVEEMEDVYESESDDQGDDELMAEVEEVALAHEYTLQREEDSDMDDMDYDDYLVSSPTRGSPSKQARF